MNKLFYTVWSQNSTGITIKAKGASSLTHKQDLEKKNKSEETEKFRRKEEYKVSQKHLLLKTAGGKQ